MPDDVPSNPASDDDPTDEPDPTDSPETADEKPAQGRRHAAQPDEGAITRAVSDALRRAAPAITGIGVLLLCLELLIGAVPPPWRTALIVVGIALAAGSWLWDLLYPNDGKRRSMIAVIVGVSVFFLVLGYILRPVIHRIHNDWLVDCADPVELTVLVPADGAAWFQESIAEFNRQNLDDDQCREANVTAYSAAWPDVERAMQQGWKPPEEDDEEAGTFEALHDVGPRPHFWIAESQSQVDLAYGLLDEQVNYKVFAPEDAEPIGRTPLVLAVPDTVLDEAGFNGGAQTTDRPLHELITALGDDHGTPVLRSDPAVSTTGLLFLQSLYGQGSAPEGVAARMENQLAAAAASTGIALSPNDTDLLCEVTRTQGANPYAAVLTTEMALARYNKGYSLGDGCALAGDERSGLVPIYGDDLGALDYQGVHFDWNGDPWAEERSEVADELQAWLAGDEDGWKPMDMGMRSEHYEREEIEGDNRFDTGFDVEADPISAREFNALQSDYGQNRPPTTVLLAIDHSGTMNEPVGGGRTRFELATDGVVTAMRYLGVNPEDQAALWTFPVSGSGSHTSVFPMTTDPPDDVADLLGNTETSEGIDLHQTVVDGLAELDAARHDEGTTAMVVLTDGADADQTPTVEQVRAALTVSQANLYLIAVGEASCRSATFAYLAEDSRVTCLEAEEEQITTTFDSLFDQLWSVR